LKLGSPKVWVTVCSLAAVVLMAITDVDRKSPGPVAAVHGQLEAVDGGASCSACHGGWFSSMTESCLECHEPIAEQLENSHGLHGILEGATGQNCAACHSEHHGEGFDLVNVRSFVMAGVPSPLKFDHARIGWNMDGRHLEIGCADCHDNARVAILAEGQPRFLGLDQDCGSCHEDPHEGRMQVSCASCHGQTTWDGLHSEGHERQLPLVGGHGDVACRTCHEEKGKHALELMGESESRAEVRTCAECHESPHKQDFAAFSARLAGFGTDRGCVTCHAAEHVTWRESASILTPGQHAFAGFPLEAPHSGLGCQQCHDPAAGAFQARHPGREAEACSTCHADPHGGQFHAGPFSGQECTACHDAQAFEPHAFTLEKHALSSLPLDGKHLDTQCNACHTIPAPEEPRSFRGISSNCGDCHADAHKGFFDERQADTELPEHGACAACHSTAGFAAPPAPDFDHAGWTGFPVLGAHAQENCTSCHPSMATRDDTHRTFGRVADHFGQFRGCVTCHVDPHEGQFDGPDLPAVVFDREGCARCHEETSFREFPRGFDHGAWTGFALIEGHGEASCAACHAPLRRPDALGRTWGRSNGGACSDCHPDPHGGQFEVEGPADCARCHASDRPAYLSFDHDRDSRFPLDGRHRELECAACHLPATLPSGDEAVRYRPLGTECVDCHGVGEDVLIRRRRK